MDSPPERSTPVTAAAVVAILGGLSFFRAFSRMARSAACQVAEHRPRTSAVRENPGPWGLGFFDLSVPLRYGNRHWTHLSSQLGAHRRPDLGWLFGLFRAHRDPDCIFHAVSHPRAV